MKSRSVSSQVMESKMEEMEVGSNSKELNRREQKTEHLSVNLEKTRLFCLLVPSFDVETCREG